MISTGQLIFAVCFVIVFVTVIIIGYRRDNKLHKKQYKNSFWVLLGFLAFVAILLLLKFFLKE